MNSNLGGRYRSSDRRSYRDRSTYYLPRPSRIRSQEYRFHPGSWIALAAILCGLAGIAYWIYSYQYSTETTVALTVNRLDDQATGNSGHKYLVFTTRADGTPEVFQNTDAIFHGKWNSSDVQAALRPGVRYTCDVYGRRHPVLSQYRDILSCTRITP